MSVTLAAIGYLLVANAALLSLCASIFGLLSSYVFFGLDRRNAFMVKLAEKDLAKFESQNNFSILTAPDDPNFFMLKYSRASKILYSGYATIFTVALLASIFKVVFWVISNFRA